MLSIGKMAAGQHQYYTGLAGADDYYLSGREPPGRWWGGGAEALGCTGQVSADDLKSLCDGFSPAGGSASAPATFGATALAAINQRFFAAFCARYVATVSADYL